MSLIYGWFWSKKPIEKSEQEKEQQTRSALFRELNQVFFDTSQKKFAERK